MNLSFLLLLYSTLASCGGDGLAEDIYVTLPVAEGVAGYRLFNGTHQFGFHRSKADSRGVVVKVARGEEAGLRDCWRSRFQGYQGKYYVLISADMIDRSLVQELLQSTCIAGLFVTDPENKVEPTEALSHDGICPNRYSGVYNDSCPTSNPWNDRGFVIPDGLRNIDWKMQILYIHNKTYIETIKKCYDLYNVPKNGSSSVHFPFCAASFGVFSSAAGSSEICYRRSKPWARLLDLSIENRDDLCSPLVGVNVLAYLPPKVYNEAAPAHTTKYLLLSTRMDSFGLIPEVSPGEVSVVTSVISLLAAAQAIGRSSALFERAANKSNRHVVVAFFDGESFDYIGSSDAVYEMMNGVFPHRLLSKFKSQLDPIVVSQVEAIVEVQQLGTGDGVKLYAHADGGQLRTGKLNDILSSLSEGVTSAGGKLIPPSENSQMPPSSWHSFSRVESSVRGIVLAPFQEKYSYRRINSMLDHAQWDSSQRTAAISEITVAATALLRAAGDHVRLETEQKSALRIDKDFVNTLFKCFIDSPDWFTCSFFNRLNGGRFKPTSAFYGGKSTYVSAGYRNPIRFFVEWLAIYATGSTFYTSNVRDKNTCDDLGADQHVYVYSWQADPDTGEFHCYRSTVDVYQVNSPAFRIQGYDFTNNTYSTWTESLYSIDNLKLYLVEQESLEMVMLGLGIAVTLLSFLIVGRCTENSFIIDEGERLAKEGEPL